MSGILCVDKYAGVEQLQWHRLVQSIYNCIASISLVKNVLQV
jgi:hypothetical protein